MGGMPGYHAVMVEQHMMLLMEAAGLIATTTNTMTTTTDLLVHTKDMATMREMVVKTSCKEYIMCNVLLLENWEMYMPLRTHLENGHVEQKKPYPTAVEDTEILLVDYKAP
jgi:hypothetical protein